MKYDKKLNLIHSKSKILWLAISVIIGIILAFATCQKDEKDDEDNNITVEYPLLKVMNQNTESRVISQVSLVFYDFNNLNISIGDSQTFTLNKGMPGGYNDINVTVYYKGGVPQVHGDESIEVNFNKGDTTTITLKGCIGFEGCQGFYLE